MKTITYCSVLVYYKGYINYTSGIPCTFAAQSHLEQQSITGLINFPAVVPPVK